MAFKVFNFIFDSKSHGHGWDFDILNDEKW